MTHKKGGTKLYYYINIILLVFYIYMGLRINYFNSNLMFSDNYGLVTQRTKTTLFDRIGMFPDNYGVKYIPSHTRKRALCTAGIGFVRLRGCRINHGKSH